MHVLMRRFTRRLKSNTALLDQVSAGKPSKDLEEKMRSFIEENVSSFLSN
jgi:hypothetical protein